MHRHFATAVILSTLLLSCSDRHTDPVYENMAGHLVGSWTAGAWAGVLNETWTRGDDGWLYQTAFYYEGMDTTYRAHSKIEKVGDDLILFSVIRNANPKIFKAVTIDADSIAFENSDYESPFRVVYFFGPKERFQRTISGYDNGRLITFTFDFNRTK